MTINEIKARLGSVNNIEIAQSTCSKYDALTKIVSEIEKHGLDVDDVYLDFLKRLEFENVFVDVKYLPIYYTTAIAKLSWKERKEGEEPTDHQEFVRFNSLFYARQNNKKERINKLDILKVLDKKSYKANETAVSGILETNQINPEVKLLGMEGYVPQVIMDVPIQEGEFYPLDNQFVLGQTEIEQEVQKSLEFTKSYRRLQKQKEKWSNIEQINVNVVLVPIACVHVGNHDQIVNCANGEMDVQYEVSRTISKELHNARLLVYPSIVLLGLMLIINFILMLIPQKSPVIFDEISFVPFQSLNGWIWLISLLMGGVFTLIAIPSRKGIIRRKTNNKNSITISKIFALLIYAIDYSLLILLLTIIQCIIAK